MRKSLTSTLTGLGVEAVGQGAPVLWPNMPSWLAWALVIFGVILIVAGVVGLVWPILVRHLPVPMWAPDFVWQRLAWLRYKPDFVVHNPEPDNIKQREQGGRLDECEIGFRIDVTPHFPFGHTKFAPGSAYLLIKHKGSQQWFVFRARGGWPPVELHRGKGPYTNVQWFRSDDVGRRIDKAPDLTRSFHWKIHRLGATFYGTRGMSGTFRPFKGFVERSDE